MPASRRISACTSVGKSSGTPSASKTSALPQRLETERLPCLATGRPQAATTTAAAVEMLSVCEPSPPVPQVSTTSGSPCSTTVIAPRIASAAPAIASAVSPPMRSATANAPICTGVHAPARIASKAARASAAPTGSRASSRASALGKWAKSALTARLLPERGLFGRARTAPARGRRGRRRDDLDPVVDQPLALARQNALGVKLHALDRVQSMPEAHDLALGRPRADLEAGRQRLALDEERVVSRRLERRGDAVEEAAAVVKDGRRLSVHQAPGAHDAPPVGLPDRLVPQTDSEDRQTAAESLQDLERDAGLVRRARTGRDEQAMGRRARMPATSIPSFLKTSTSAPSSPRYWTRLKVNES